MAKPPVYEVEFIPLEQRLSDRRKAPKDAPLPPDVKEDRRKNPGRRPGDRKPDTPKAD